MGPITSVYTTFIRSFSYFGRASRSEFIWFALFCALGYAALDVLQSKVWGWTLKGGANVDILTSAFPFIVGLPAIALSVRRMQDIGLHPIILAIPSVLLYTRLHLGIILARSYESFVNPDFDGRGPTGNIFAKISQLLYSGQSYIYWALLILLILAPKNAIHKLPLLLQPAPEDKP